MFLSFIVQDGSVLTASTCLNSSKSFSLFVFWYFRASDSGTRGYGRPSVGSNSGRRGYKRPSVGSFIFSGVGVLYPL